MSQGEMASRRISTRMSGALPHFGALVSGIAAIWGWYQFAGSEWSDSLFATSVYLVAMMASPIVGASLILLFQGGSQSPQPILAPYVWWAVAGLLAVLLLMLAGANSGSNSPAPPIVRFAFLAALVLGWLVPVVIPFLRTIMWLVSPPKDRVHAELDESGIARRSVDPGR